MKYIKPLFIAALILLSNCPSYGSSEEEAYLLNKKGIQKLERSDFEGAIVDFKSALNFIPSNSAVRRNLANAYNNYGFSLMKSGQLTRAIEKLESAVYYDADNAYALYNLGNAYYQNQNIEKARACFERVAKVAPDIPAAKAMAEKLSRETKVEERFERTDTAHFIIAASKDVPVASFSYIRTYLEEAYGRIGGWLDRYPKNKVVVILYSEANYEAMLGGRPHWTMGIFDGKMRIPVNKFKYTNDEVLKIIYHEYAHAVMYDITRTAPLWISEGVACRAEDMAGPRDAGIIKRYFEKYAPVPYYKISNDFTRSGDSRQATLLYIEAYTMVDFIEGRGGITVLRSILRMLSQGYDITRSLQQVLGVSLDDFDRRWKAYVREKYGVDFANKGHGG